MVLAYVITAILGAVLMYCMYYLASMNRNYWKKRGVPNIPSMPFLGIMWDALSKRKGLTQILNEIYTQLNGERFGGYFQFASPVLMIRDPELINQVLIKDFVHFEDRTPSMKDAHDLFSEGLPNLTGDEWRRARHRLTPTFTSGKLKMMLEPIAKCGDDAVSYINKNLNQDINAKDFSLKFILNVIASVAFGLKINTLEEDKDSDFYKASSKFFKPSLIFVLKMSVAMFLPKVKNFFKLKLTDDDVEVYFRKLTKDIITHRESTGVRRNDFLQIMLDQREKEKNQLHNGQQSTITDKDDIDDEDKELLDQLKYMPAAQANWNNSAVFTEEFIAGNTFVFMSGGSETTATVLNFVLYELAVNKECQKRAQQEIDDILRTNEFNYQSVKRMTYIEQVINETLRCNPLGGGFMRICTQDYKIPGSEVTIEKGTFVTLPIAALHKDPQYFPEPEKFNPDRFENMDTIPKGVYFNFGYGPRMCIAARLAMLEMKVFLVKLLINYDIILSARTKLPLKLLKASVMANVDGGIWIKLVKRQT